MLVISRLIRKRRWGTRRRESNYDEIEGRITVRPASRIFAFLI